MRVGLLNGPAGQGRIEEQRPQEVLLACVFETKTKKTAPTDLILAIPRPKVLTRILPDLASFGLRRIVLLRTWRVNKPYLSSHVLSPDRYRPLLHEGLMQGGLTVEPELIIEPAFKPFVEDRLPAWRHDTRIVADPRARAHMGLTSLGAEDSVALAIGPEGGLISYELESFERAGFVARRVASSILRVKAACISALAGLDLLRHQPPPRAESQ